MTTQTKPEDDPRVTTISYLIVFGLIAFVYVKCNNACNAPPRPETKLEQIRGQFSAWDGSHKDLTRRIKEKMANPSDYTHIETSYVIFADSTVLVTTIFAGRNVFGGPVRKAVGATYRANGDLIRINEWFD